MMTAKMSMKMLASLGAAALAASAGMASARGFESNGHTTEVRYHDLDLSTPYGQRALNARIKRAAVKVCPADTIAASKQCQKLAVANLRAPIDADIAKAQSRSEERFAELGKEQAAPAGK